MRQPQDPNPQPQPQSQIQTQQHIQPIQKLTGIKQYKKYYIPILFFVITLLIVIGIGLVLKRF